MKDLPINLFCVIAAMAMVQVSGLFFSAITHLLSVILIVAGILLVIPYLNVFVHSKVHTTAVVIIGSVGIVSLSIFTPSLASWILFGICFVILSRLKRKKVIP